ncbi:acyl-CoA dehydrogenase family protein [Micromonospora sp. DT48]|uniref:acyl-CoA dehydrogenase family protein n=1 Tax=unclassified Micromonospora TaxID=2617518 RepID=UPI002815CCA6|nr:acyl-CoA dehydrogenase family protein [Micromonospora sp. CP22]
MRTDALDRVDAVVGALTAGADEAERSAQLPADTVTALRTAGLFRMVVPARYGGDELPVSEVLPVLAALSRTDPSVGWVVGQVALSQLIIGCGGPETAAEVYADGPDVVAAGAVAIKGRAASTADGWQVSGRWPFVSGCRHASWFYLNCAVQDGRSLARGPDGEVSSRMVVLPASAVTIEPSWQALGLRGTGSHDVTVTRALCPDHRGFTGSRTDPGAEVVADRVATSSLIIAAVALGIAEGATTELIELVMSGKRPALSRVPLSRSPQLQDQLGEADVRCRAARTVLLDAARAAEQQIEASPARRRARTRATAAHLIAEATAVVDTAYRLAGGTAVYDSCPLQRRFRDMRTAAQHFVAGRQSFAALGASLVGETPDDGGR